MSPVPIIARQRALSRIGEIRIGGEQRVNPKSGKPLVGQKLDTFRLTSQQQDIIDRCASLYGGKVTEWESPAGQAWQVVTERAALPILVMPGYSLTLLYEHWEGATKCERRCDGQLEMLSGGPCVCNERGEDICDIVTRLIVVLPETGTSLGWYLRSTGQNAAMELGGAMAVADGIANGRTFLPATLRLTQRRAVKDGHVLRYAVPVIDFDLPRAALLDPAARQLPPGHTPVDQPPKGLPLADGLEAVNKQAEPKTGGRRPAPLPATGATVQATVPVPVDEEPAGGHLITADQRTRLWAISHECGLDETETRQTIQDVTGQEHSTQIPKHQYDEVIRGLLLPLAAEFVEITVSLGGDPAKMKQLADEHAASADVAWFREQLEKGRRAKEHAAAQGSIFQTPPSVRKRKSTPA